MYYKFGHTNRQKYLLLLYTNSYPGCWKSVLKRCLYIVIIATSLLTLLMDSINKSSSNVSRDASQLFHIFPSFLSLERATDPAPVIRLDRPVTVVTAFYVIPSKRRERVYLKWLANFLQLIPCHLYVFTDPQSYLKVRTQRAEFLNITQIIVRPFLQLKEVKRMSIWNQQRKLDVEEEKHSPELYAMWNEKVHMLLEAINDNPFDSDYFLWTDIGSFRNKEQAKKLSSFPDTHTASLLGTDRVFFLQVGDFREDHLQIGWNGLPRRDFQHDIGAFVKGVSGTTFGGHSHAIRQYERRYYETMELMRSNGLFIGKDQNIMSTVAVLYPELVKLVKPQYYLDGADPWFYAHYYFSRTILNESTSS